MAREEPEADEGGPETDRPMTLGQHLEELRRRVFRAVLYVAAGAGLAVAFEDEIVGFVLTPYWEVLRELPKAGFQVTEVAEAFFARMWLDVVVGLVVAGPLVLLEIWGFVAKGLYDREKRWVRIFAPISLFLFLEGFVFYHFVIQPVTLRTLLTYGTQVPVLGGAGIVDVAVQLKLESALRLYLVMSLVMGLTFQLPLGMVFVQKLEVVNWRSYSKYRPHFVLAAAVVMAILTPTGDAVTLAICMVPVVLLFEGGILVCRLMNPHVPKDDDAD
jgi:sec-independent protein translocase protein TatC